MANTLRKDNVIFNIVTTVNGKKGKLGKNDVDKLGDSAERTEKKFEKAGNAFGKIATAATALAAVAAVAAITNAALDAAAAFEQTTVSFVTLTGSTQVAKELVQTLEDISIVTPFSPEEVIKAGRTLLAFGADADTVGQTVINLGEAAAATGAPLESLAFIFGQASATGVIMTEDLNQLATAGLPILKLVADEMGVLEGEVRKLASEGKISFDILEGAFARAAGEGGKFAGALKAQSLTLAGLKSTVVGVKETFLRAFGQKILEPAKQFQRILIGMWTAAKNFISLDLAEQLQQEKLALNVLVSEINDTNTSQERRNELISQLQDEYPDFLGNLDAETASTAELKERLAEVNEEYRARIDLAVATKAVEEAEKELSDAFREGAAAAFELRQKIIAFRMSDKNGLTEELAGRLENTAALKDQVAILKEFIDSTSNVTARSVEQRNILFDINNLTWEEVKALARAEEAQIKLNIAKTAQSDVETGSAAIFAELDARAQARADKIAGDRKAKRDFAADKKARALFLKGLPKRIKMGLKAIKDREKLELTLLKRLLADKSITEAEFDKKELKRKADSLQKQLDLLKHFGQKETAQFKQLGANLALLIAEGVGSADLPRDFLAEFLMKQFGNVNKVRADLRKIIAEQEALEIVELQTSLAKKEITQEQFDKSLLDIKIKSFDNQLALLKKFGLAETAEFKKVAADKALLIASSGGTSEDPTVAAAQAAFAEIEKIQQMAFAAEVARTDKLISLQEDRVSKAKEIAERGNAEQLQLEEDRLEELLQKREAAARRQQAIDTISIISAHAVAAAESIKAIAKGFSGPGSIAQGIATAIALAASIGAIVLTVSNAFSEIPSFDVGTDRIDGDMTARVHKGERILTAKQNAELGQIPNSDIPALVNLGAQTLMNRSYIYSQNKEMTSLMRAQNEKIDTLIDAQYGDANRMARHFAKSSNSRSRRQLNLLR